MPIDQPALAELTQFEVDAIAQAVSNWGRWGPTDQRGTLNLLTPAHVRAAGALIRVGTTVSCALPIATWPRVDNPFPARHLMLAAGDAARHDPGMPGFEAAFDLLLLQPHGPTSSHIDALSHVFIDGRMYNDIDSGEVRSDGARTHTVMNFAGGIVGRGVLLDIPAAHDVEWLELGYAVTVADLEAAEARQDVRVGEGDILLVSTGRDARRDALGPWAHRVEGMAGLAVECLPWLHDRRIAVLGCDGISDTLPTDIPGWRMPIHEITLVMMGCPLLDNLRLDLLMAACQEQQRWTFHYSVAPLHIERGTGCPVNPIATF
jgi:kynurenine formamidase